jgi:hypothetical protein
MSQVNFDSYDGRDRRQEVRMSPGEIDEFLRTCTNQMVLVTANSDDTLHAVPMGFGLDGQIHMKSKARAQKVTTCCGTPGRPAWCAPERTMTSFAAFRPSG